MVFQNIWNSSGGIVFACAFVSLCGCVSLCFFWGVAFHSAPVQDRTVGKNSKGLKMREAIKA